MPETTSTRVDTNNEYNWSEITSTFEDGELISELTTFDNGNTQYDDGKPDVTLQFDGNDSDDWLLKVTDRQSDGSASIITTFDAYEGIPQEYQDYLRELNPPTEEIEYILDFNDGARLHDGERIFDGAISVHVYTPDNANPDSQGALLPYEYSGRTSAIGADPDLEATNTYASTIAFTATNYDDFIFHSISLANDYMMTGGVDSRSDLSVVI